jgi:mono/diheme cytochrome c family protein
MKSYSLDRTRRMIGYGLVVAAALEVAWALMPGLPVWWGPRASAEERAAGLALFEHEWQPSDPLAGGDGLGPVFNDRSCVACHFQGGVGGGGGNRHNVSAFEVLPTQGRPELKAGLVHASAVDNRFRESRTLLRTMFPIVPGSVRLEGGCQVITQDFDPIRSESINATALFGAGWIDRISGKTIKHLALRKAAARVGKELGADFEGTLPGRPRVLPDGRVGKFGWKAQFGTLEEFVAAACANEIGLGNPLMEQARPLGKTDYPFVAADLRHEQFRSLVKFVETLPRPEELEPADLKERSEAARGKVLFERIGCAVCHVADIGGVSGVYSDFLLHRLDDHSKGNGYRTVQTPEVPLPEEHPLPEEWKTPPLWGVADSAPYFHDGGSPTLEAAILRHLGNAASVTQVFKSLALPDRDAIIGFLKTLKAPVEAKPAETGGTAGKLALAR